MKMKIFFILLTCLAVTKSYCQNNKDKILGIWYVVEEYSIDFDQKDSEKEVEKEVEKFINQDLSRYSKNKTKKSSFEFTKQNIVKIADLENNVSGEGTYKISENSLFLNDNEFTIKKLSNDRLVIHRKDVFFNFAMLLIK